MSNAEHLIDNAIACYEENHNFHAFHNDYFNQEMAESIDVSLFYIEEMAYYVCNALKEEWQEKWEIDNSAKKEWSKKWGY